MSDLTSELLTAIVAAPSESKRAALDLLRGKAPAEDAPRPLLYAPTEAAVLLSVSRSTLWRLIRSGRLTRVEVMPGFFRITRASLMALAGRDS